MEEQKKIASDSQEQMTKNFGRPKKASERVHEIAPHCFRFIMPVCGGLT